MSARSLWRIDSFTAVEQTALVRTDESALRVRKVPAAAQRQRYLARAFRVIGKICERFLILLKQDLRSCAICFGALCNAPYYI